MKKYYHHISFGFRSLHSTVQQVHLVMAETIAVSTERKQYCSGVFLDEAFDRIEKVKAVIEYQSDVAIQEGSLIHDKKERILFLADASTDEDEEAQRAGTNRRVIYHQAANVEDSPNILEGIYPRLEVDRYRPSRAERSPILAAILEHQRSSTVQEENTEQAASLSTEIETPERNEESIDMPNTDNRLSLSTEIESPERNEESTDMPNTDNRLSLSTEIETPERNEDNTEMANIDNRLRSGNINDTEEPSSEISITNLRNRSNNLYNLEIGNGESHGS
ncbi:uncharacterized protein LOC106667254 [Cimex lectularius]|uniref:Uncharacterized protein n=1 Tax=Cimex lectularius TaxID=79782 RepID=A0A8I6RQF2_CIMLE|nr:uncharacterized protein LOC106667254 [Cimex lectularius]